MSFCLLKRINSLHTHTHTHTHTEEPSAKEEGTKRGRMEPKEREAKQTGTKIEMGEGGGVRE